MHVSLITKATRCSESSKGFFPAEPTTLAETGLEKSFLEALVLRFMMTEGVLSGRDLALKLCLPIALTRDLLDMLRNLRLLQHRSATFAGDFNYELTDAGRERALRLSSGYFGPAPVSFAAWEESVFQQAAWRQVPGQEELREALKDLLIPESLFHQLGPAIAGNPALVLYGAPGNGKTSIGERLSRALSGDIWVPHAIELGGVVLKLYDSLWHQAVEMSGERHDKRWLQIERPCVQVGAELSLELLEVQSGSGMAEAPVQLKAGGGILLVDDFGRQRISCEALLNRWITMLERKRDFLKMPDGRKIPVPYGAVTVFATNLELSRFLDEAFARRVPNKVLLPNPTAAEFTQLTLALAKSYGVKTSPDAVAYLFNRHYKESNRNPRFCHPRDLVRQVASQARWEGKEAVAGPAEWDVVVGRLFGEG
jgi:hypothetical protein